jgi:predicted dehydrogenase
VSRTVRVGILGVGHIGVVHLQSACAIEGVTVPAVADAVPANRRRATRLGAGAAYEDYRDLLDSEPLDAVVVALPPFLHADAVEAAAEAGCHAFVEKPFARDVEEGRRMVATADDHGVFLGVDHTLRYQPDMVALKDAYDEGGLGHVPQCTAARLNSGPFGSPPINKPVSGWQLSAESTGGGALLDLGTHLVDVLEWLFGDLTVEHAEFDRQLGYEYEDTATVVFRAAETGTIATVNCGFYQWEEPPEVTNYVRLDGIADSLSSEAFTPDQFVAHAGRSAAENVLKRLRGEDLDYFEPTYYYQAHYRALADFLEAVADDREPPVDGEMGLETLELVETAYEVADFDRGTPADEAPSRAGGAQ